MSRDCPITACPAVTRPTGCGFHQNGQPCQHPKWRDAYRWCVHPVRSVLSVIAQIGRVEWNRRVAEIVQGRLL